ncbi:hypothetical protein [Rhodococcus gannanensis]|uniref:Secreted protein n=1 Tax=Rhodococcus gannanensis TaxID=1960308 RepID=A0ABW4P0S9_9NOCA
MTPFRRVAACAAIVLGAALPTAGHAAAAVTVPFQIDPAPFGNPNGSFDVPPIRCAAVVGDRAVTITGGKQDGWGCLLSSPVQWLNLSTGARGTATLSDGLNGIPPAVTLDTGAGQVVVMVNSVTGGPVTPGFATFHVP